jgi:hypothetical protein
MTDAKYPAKPRMFGLNPGTRERIDGLATEIRKGGAVDVLMPRGKESPDPQKQKPRR